ncbi:vitelline membrane outer layer protein 1 homolog [Ambystoma mexicanum]|uniref:vitelline membrane outer layer protein 1 homolog n=1 Tax=Ambystoma mexicanum TaxID=8296 RepID=UPI0037E866A1
MAHALGLAALLLLCTCVDGRTPSNTISVPNGGPWGDWEFMDMCPAKQYARGFSLKIEPRRGSADDTSVNGIRLICPGPGSETLQFVESAVGRWGNWSSVLWCSEGIIQSFALRVEVSQGDGDDTAVNNIKFFCSDGAILEIKGGKWGSYGESSDSCKKGICGMQTRVQKPQGTGDDTALNDVRFSCCTD